MKLRKFFKLSGLKIFYTLVIISVVKFALFLLVISIFGTAALFAFLAYSLAVVMAMVLIVAVVAYGISSWILWPARK